MAKTNPILLAAIGVGGAYLLTRQGRAQAEDAPPPPSSQGQFTLKTTGVESSGYQIGQKSQVILPARYGYVQPAFAAVSNPILGRDNKLMVGTPHMWASSHSGAFRLQAGRVNGNQRTFVTTTRLKRSYIIGINSGVYGIPSRQSLRMYYGRRVGYDNFDENLSQLFRWDVIPSGAQSSMYADVIRYGQQYLVPDTELSASQFERRSTTGQVSSSYQNRNGSTFVEREGFYHNGEAFIRTDGPAGSLNWGDISDENPDILYYVAESGMVAINRRNRQTVPVSTLRPRWKNLPYGAVPHGSTPWTNSVFQPEVSDITGGVNSGRSFWWSTNQDLNSDYFGRKTVLYRNWPDLEVGRDVQNVGGAKARIYPNPSAFVGFGVGLYKFRTNTGNTSFGCRGNR